MLQNHFLILAVFETLRQTKESEAQIFKKGIQLKFDRFELSAIHAQNWQKTTN